MKKSSVLGGLAFAAILGSVFAFPAYAKEKTYPEGIYAGDFALGGLTKEQAEKEFAAYISGLEVRSVTLDVAGTEVETTAKALGYSCKNEDALQEAEEYAAGGCLIRQYMERKDLEKEPVHISLDAGVDDAAVQAFVEEQCSGLPGEPQDAAITRVNGRFEITPEKSGMAVDVKATIEKLNEELGKENDAVSVEAVVTEQEPKIKKEDLETISDVLGTCTTAYASSGASRSGNIANGASKINGHVLMPGETLSGYECMHPFTIENGYFTAAAYENGQVVDSVGGGVCQIATTLYGASLQAELEITQRQNHSMIVTYVKPSMDAAIAGTYKDIKITNNYSTPIYIEGTTAGKTLTFTIYGKETRPANRKVEYISETLSKTDPGEPQRKVDNSLKPGQIKQVQSAHIGYKSRLWKVVTVDGVEKERTILHIDTYNPSKAIVLVGSAVPEAAETQAQPAEAQPEQAAPAETAAPQPSQSQVVGSGAVSQPSESSSGGPGAVSQPLESSGGGPGAESQPSENSGGDPGSAPATAEAAPAPASEEPGAQ